MSKIYDDIVKFMNSEVFRFAVVGVVATAINYAIYWLLIKLFPGNGMTFTNIAYAIGYFIAFLFNFYCSSYYTFKRTPTWSRFISFAGTNIFNYFLQTVILNVSILLGSPEEYAPIFVYLIAVPVNFLLVRFVFHHTKDKNKTEQISEKQ